jgi:hypothetical protein
MRARWAAPAGAVIGLAAVLAVAPARAQQNDFLGNMKNFFSGMTPNGSMRQAYEAGRRDEYAALQSQRERLCAPQAYGAQPPSFDYGVGGYGPFANR